MFHDIMIAFICIGAYAILILYGIKRTENCNMLPDPIPCRGDVGMWTLGADIVRLEKVQPWGSKFMQRVSADLKTWMPEAKCFSVRNLQYMRLFASIYGGSEITHQVGAQLGVVGATHQVGAQIVHQLGDQLQLGQFEAQPIFSPSLLLALRTIPARAAAESHFGDGG